MSNRKRGDAEAICCETFLTGLTPQRASEAHRCWMICWKMPRITNASRLYSLHQSFQAGSYKKIAGIYNFDPRHMALPIRLPLFDHISDILTNVKLAELLITQLSFGPRVLLDLFPHSFQLPQYLAVRHQVAHLHTV